MPSNDPIDAGSRLEEEPLYPATPTEVVHLAAAMLTQAFGDNDRMVHHYTTFEGLHGILKSSQLWATDTRFLNDTSERKHSGSALSEFLMGLKPYCEPIFLELLESCVTESFGATFVVCFCEHNDLLSMWRAYGSNGGFNIGFDGKALREFLNPTYETFGKVKYDLDLRATLEEPFKKLCDLMKSRSIDEWNRIGIRGSLAQLMVLIKHPSFREEQEWRIVIPEQDVPMLDFRSTVSGPKPYVSFPLKFADSNPGEAARLLPIRNVMIGPTTKSSDMEHLVRQMLWGTDDIYRSLILGMQLLPVRTAPRHA